MAVTDKFYFLGLLQQYKSFMNVKNSKWTPKQIKAEINYATINFITRVDVLLDLHYTPSSVATGRLLTGERKSILKPASWENASFPFKKRKIPWKFMYEVVLIICCVTYK